MRRRILIKNEAEGVQHSDTYC